jgi:hypothetical protein
MGHISLLFSLLNHSKGHLKELPESYVLEQVLIN